MGCPTCRYCSAASPVYYGGVAGQVIVFLERFFSIESRITGNLEVAVVIYNQFA